MKVIIGLSGGVDSAVAALLMRQQGYDLIGCTLKMQESEKNEKSIKDAEKIAEFLKIPHFVIDCIKDFTELVINYFIDSYKNGETPNPCIICNSVVKFKYLNDFRKKHNADMIVTGHYAILKTQNETVELYQAKDFKRDQSYFLYLLDKEILFNTNFPLGEYSKEEIREIAKEHGIIVANKPDSQDICFIENSDYISYIKKKSNITFEKGDIIDTSGNVLGNHKGIINYTIGQRKGLGLPGGPFFVSEIDISENKIIVSSKEDIKSETIKLKNVKFINEEIPNCCFAKIRSSGKRIKCKIFQSHGNKKEYIVKLLEPEYGIAKGQHCVFFENNKILGGGEIY